MTQKSSARPVGNAFLKPCCPFLKSRTPSLSSIPRPSIASTSSEPPTSPWHRRQGLQPAASFALVDGLPVHGLPVEHHAIVQGDHLSSSIAAASILAKVTRDRIMLDLDTAHPGYDFAVHKGYPTRQHLAALTLLGPSPVHRRSFAPVRAIQTELFEQ